MGKEDGFRTSRALSDGPTFYTVVRGGKRPNREKVGKDRQAADRRLREIWTQVDAGSYIPASERKRQTQLLEGAFTV
jgi:hypothetical protein